MEVRCPRCREEIPVSATYCTRCGLKLPSFSIRTGFAPTAEPALNSGRELVKDRPHKRGWYQIGRLGPNQSAWANLLLVNLGFAGWLLLTDKSPDTASAVGGFIGSAVGQFGFCGAFGWVASSFGGRLFKWSQASTMAAFVLGAAGIFSLVVLGNSPMNRVQASAVSPRQAGNEDSFPAVNHDPFAALPSADSLPSALPQPAPEPKPPPGVEEFVRSHSTQIREMATAPAPDIDLPASEVARLKVVGHPTFNDLRLDISQPPGWIISSIVFERRLVGAPAELFAKRFLVRTYVPLDGEDGAAHVYIVDFLRPLPGEPSGQTVTGRIVSAKGHQVR